MSIIKVLSDLQINLPPHSKNANKICHSNIQYNTKYKGIGHGSLKEIRFEFTDLKHDLNTHISIIVTGPLTPNFICNVYDYFKYVRPKLTNPSQIAHLMEGKHSISMCKNCSIYHLKTTILLICYVTNNTCVHA